MACALKVKQTLRDPVCGRFILLLNGSVSGCWAHFSLFEPEALDPRCTITWPLQWRTLSSLQRPWGNVPRWGPQVFEKHSLDAIDLGWLDGFGQYSDFDPTDDLRRILKWRS